ncbi:MAG: hypothetical protein NTY38_32630, partial [Acidobacteria bacterium]|nr:hypothetical protein [Acidobacteriota bacterium]
MTVATLPAFEASAIASRYGTGFRRNAKVISRIRGVSARQTVSFTKKAEKTPDTATTAASKAMG